MKFREQLGKNGLTEEELDEKFKELVEPEVDPEADYYRYVFAELSSTRQQGLNGQMPITYLEIKAYLELNDVDLSPQEVQLIKVMDRAYLQEVAKLSKEQE